MGEEKNRGSQLAQILLCVLVFVFACCAIVFVALYFIKYGEDNASKDDMPTNVEDFRDVCTSDACVNIASTILNNADLSLDPCEDFYDYACSNYVRFTPIPESGSAGVWDSIGKGVNWRLKALLEKEYNSANFPKPVNDALNFYKSCMDEDKIEELNLAPIEDLVNFYGGFPVTDPDWDPNDFDLTIIMADLIRTSLVVNVFFTANVNTGTADTSKYNIELVQTYFTLGRDAYLEERDSDVLKAYEQYAVDIAVLMGADQTTAEADMKAMVDWEVDMAPLQPTFTEWRQTDFVVLTIEELYNNITDKINWIQFFNTIFQETDRTFSMNDTIEMKHRIWFERLAEKWDTFDKRIVANYIMFRLINGHIIQMPKVFRDAAEKLSLVRFGSTGARPRWELCVLQTNYWMRWAVSRLYVEEIFDDSYQNKVTEMLRVIRAAMDSMLDEVLWLDEETREKAKLKLSELNEAVGYPEYLLDDDRLLRYYPGLVVEPDTFLANMRSMFEAWKLDFLLRMDQPADDDHWLVAAPTTFNALYFAQGNVMVFPAVFFTEPIFHLDYADYVNFGLAGMVMGHEVTHAFDNRGRHYDEKGRFTDWWDDQTEEVYKNKTQCLIDQYSNYEQQGANVDGKLSLEENMADNGGTVAAFRAYKMWLKEKGIEREPKLPGIDLTPDQLFFLSFGQFHCFTATDEILLRATSNIYPPKRYRVNGPLSNMPEFANAFKCPENSPMNPSEKCPIWNELATDKEE